MNKKLRILTALILIMVMSLGMTLEAEALRTSVTYVGKLTRRASLPNVEIGSDNCVAVNAMGVSRGTNCLYTIKINQDDDRAIMYYFPDITDWNNKIWIELVGVGHANGMTVDTEYIYIGTGLGTYNNKIVRINRQLIENANQRDDFSVANGKIQEMNVVTQSDDGSYVPYTSGFSTISRDKTTGTFIIGKRISGVTTTDEYSGFTRARVEGTNFIVSTDTDDMFLVENLVDYPDAAKQDICYVDGYGLFIGRWYKAPDDDLSDEINAQRDPLKNDILWADIDRTADYQYMGYDCYTPDVIEANGHNLINAEFNVPKYSKFEIESMGITAQGNLIATFNILFSEEYKNAYQAEYGEEPTGTYADGVYKITKQDGSKFTLT